MACPRDADGKESLQIWRVAVSILNTQPIMDGPPASGLIGGLHKKKNYMIRNFTQDLGRRIS
jgi:hypothetical protein